MPRVPLDTSGVVDVILPCLDEELAVAWVLDRMPPGFRPLVVDNGSTDRTAAVARGLGAEVVSAPQRGFGAACWAGLTAASSDVVCFLDCDASFDPHELTAVAEPVLSGRADLVLGRRVAEPGTWPLHARLGNRVLARRVSRQAGVRVTDIGPARSARREALLALGMVDRRFGWPVEMVVRAGQAGWTVEEVPVRQGPRLGRSKVTGTWAGSARTVRDMTAVLRALPS